jgi:hypothetical protein
VAAVLALQALVPGALLLAGGERPVRFGWQMYSAVRSWPDVDAVRADGTVEPLTMGDLGAQRLEIRPDADLFNLVCAADPEIAELRVREDTGTTVHRCAP